MIIKDRLLVDMKNAMRAKDKSRLESIRLLRAAIQRREIDARGELNDEGVLYVVQRMIDQGKDSIAQFTFGNRLDLVTKEQVTIDVIKEYLPKQLDETEIQKLIDEAFNVLKPESMRDMGKVISWLKPKLQGRADMKSVSASIKQRIAGIV